MKVAYCLPFIAVLTACGGGSGSSSSSSTSANLTGVQASAPLSVMVTDNLSTEYAEVWVTLYEVTAKNSAGVEVKLFENQAGKIINLRELFGVGSLLNMDTFPAGSYSNIEVHADSKVNLVKTDGTTIAARFSNSSGQVTLPVAGSVKVDSQQKATLLVDFDLSKFNYEPSTNLVTGSLAQKSMSALEHVRGEIKGVISKVDSSTQFRIRTGKQGEVTVQLSNTSLVSRDDNSQPVADSSILQVGQTVEVKGNYDTSNLILLARNVKIEGSQPSNSANRNKVEGVVKSIANGGMVVDLKQANFMPNGDTLTVINLANANFHRGSLDSLSVGQHVELRGTWDGSSFTANRIEVEGGLSYQDKNLSVSDSYIELEGVLNNNKLQVSKVEHSNTIHVSDLVTLDVSKAWYEHGMSSCMSNGAKVSVKGALVNGVLKANAVEIEHGCTTTYREEYEKHHPESKQSEAAEQKGDDFKVAKKDTEQHEKSTEDKRETERD